MNEVKTIYPGGDTPPIKTYPEKMEKEVRNMIMRNLKPWIGGAVDEPRWSVADVEGLMIDVIEYITKT